MFLISELWGMTSVRSHAHMDDKVDRTLSLCSSHLCVHTYIILGKKAPYMASGCSLLAYKASFYTKFINTCSWG